MYIDTIHKVETYTCVCIWQNINVRTVSASIPKIFTYTYICIAYIVRNVYQDMSK